jgi:hypothetical protein
VREIRHSEVDLGVTCRQVVDLGEFLLGSGEADLEPFDFTEPALAAGFVDAGQQVVTDLEQARALGRVRAEQGAAQAPLTELTAMFQQFMACFRLSALTCPRDRIG